MSTRLSRMAACVLCATALMTTSGCLLVPLSVGKSGSPSSSDAQPTLAEGMAAAEAVGRTWITKVARTKKLPDAYQGLTSDYQLMKDAFLALQRDQLIAICPAVRGGADTYPRYAQGAGSWALPAGDYQRQVAAICAAKEPDEMTFVWRTLG